MPKFSIYVPEDLWLVAKVVHDEKCKECHTDGRYRGSNSSHIMQVALRGYSSDYEVVTTVRKIEGVKPCLASA